MTVSNEELLNDIDLTEDELYAYKDIAHGFKILARLPENEGSNRLEYLYQSDKYELLAEDCEKFLCKLYELKKERNL